MLKLAFGTNQKIPALVSKFLLTGDEPSSAVNDYADLKEPIPSAIKALVDHGLEVHFVQLDYDQNLLSVVCREFDEFQTGKAFGALCLIPGLTPYQQTVRSIDGKKFTEIAFTNSEKFELGEEMIPHALKAWDGIAWMPDIDLSLAYQIRNFPLEVGPTLPYCSQVVTDLISYMKKEKFFNQLVLENVYCRNPNPKPYLGKVNHHNFILVGSRHSGQIFIVDPTYQQFVPEEEHPYLPKIMVINSSSLESIKEGLIEYEISERFHHFWINENLLSKLDVIKKQIPNPENAFF